MSIHGPKEIFHEGTIWRRNDKFFGRYECGAGLSKSLEEIEGEESYTPSFSVLGRSSSGGSGGIVTLLLLPVLLGILLIGSFIIPLALCLPLWLRVFLHPSVVREHVGKARNVAILGTIVTSLYVVAGFLKLHVWDLSSPSAVFGWSGAFMLAIGTLTVLNGWLQLGLFQGRPCRGNGYGLANLYCLFVKSGKPSHLLTFFQDCFLFSLLLYWLVITCPVKEQPIPFAFFLVTLLITFGYNWSQDSRYKYRYNDELLLHGRNERDRARSVRARAAEQEALARSGKFVRDPFD